MRWPNHASGFCVYNDAALSVAALLAEGVRKVAYIDVDAHHGDGVQTAFYGDPRVLTVSIHQTPLSLFPFTGYPTECGAGAADGTSVNIAVPAGTTDASWLRAFHAVVPGVVRAFEPEVLVTQHGTDSHREDPLTDMKLTVDGQRASYLALRELAETVTGGRWLALGGGGYSPVRVAPRSWTHLLAIVADRDLDPATAVPDDWLARAAAARPGVELPTTMSDGVPNPVAVPALGRHGRRGCRPGHPGHPRRHLPAARAGRPRPARLTHPGTRSRPRHGGRPGRRTRRARPHGEADPQAPAGAGAPGITWTFGPPNADLRR